MVHQNIKMNSLSVAEHKFLKDGIADDFRNDGRGRFDYRNFSIELGTVSQASGSARVKWDNTDILVGIKAEITNVDAENPLNGKISCTVECTPSASQEFEGKGAQEINTELGETVQRILDQKAAIDLEKLCIIPGRQCWILYIDALVLDNGGNLIDAIVMGIRAALADTKLPKVEISINDGMSEIELVNDPSAFTPIDISKIPITVTLSQVKLFLNIRLGVDMY